MRGTSAILALAVTVAACDDPQSTERAPSDMHVHVYVERDDSLGMDTLDTPLRATVTVQGEESPFHEASDSTGPDGVVVFPDVPGGRYTISHEATELPAGLEPLGSKRQSVYAPPAGDTVVTRFVYADAPAEPDSIAGD